MSSVHGIDASPHQHHRGGPGINWEAVYQAGVRFVYLRAREGKDADEFPDGYSFQRHRQEALDAGLLVGAYQLYRGRHPPRYQAELLLESVGELRPGELPPAIDLEGIGLGRGPGSSERDLLPAVEVRAGLVAWVERVRQGLGIWPTIYTCPSDWAWIGGAVLSEVAACPLWLAAYADKRPAAPKPWQRLHIWQHSGSGRVEGIRPAVDLNLWQGTLDELQAWAVQAPEPTAPPAPSTEQVAQAALGLGQVAASEGINEAIRKGFRGGDR